MLPKENRLKKKKEFEAIFKGGRSLRSLSFFLKYLGNGTENTKVGFVVSKKVSKRAVERNKAKRRLREAFREVKDEIREGVSVVVVANPSIKDRAFKEIKEEVSSILKKGELIK